MGRTVHWGVLFVFELLCIRRVYNRWRKGKNYMLEIEQMGRCILEDEEPLIMKEETLRNHRILDMVFESL